MFKRPESDYQHPDQPIPAVVPRANPGDSRRESATIGPSISIKGDLTGEEDLVIQGRVEGKVDLKQNSVTIGKNGRIKADIYGRIIIVEGEVEGSLFALEQIAVRGTGTVHGNISSPRVSIDDGAKFKGGIDMESKAAEKPRANPPVEPRIAATAASGAEHALKAGITIKSENAPKVG